MRGPAAPLHNGTSGSERRGGTEPATDQHRYGEQEGAPRTGAVKSMSHVSATSERDTHVLLIMYYLE